MSLHNEMNVAENEYTQSVKDIADTRMEQANDMANFSQFSNEATNLASEQADLDRNLARATVNDANTATATAKDSYREQALANNQVASYKDYLNSAIEKKQKKNQLILGYKQLASDRAKMKYELATQRLAQAQASWNAAGNILKGLGCMISLIPGAGTAIGAGLMVGGTALGITGSAVV